MTSATCRPEISDGGFPYRTALVLARESGLLTAYLGDVAHAVASSRGRSPGGDLTTAEPEMIVDAEPDPDAEPAGGVPTIGDVIEVLGRTSSSAAPGAAFVAGRCVADELDAAALTNALTAALDASRPTASRRAGSLLHANAALSLALRGEADAGVAALRSMVEARSTLDDSLAAYHLAQLGDPSGYPLVCDLLNDDIPHVRTIAARYLAGFVPWNGQTVGGRAVDVVAMLAGQLNDKDKDVAAEIPGLLAEADPNAAVKILAKASRNAKHRGTRKVAAAVLERLGSVGF